MSLAPGNHMRPGDGPERFSFGESRECHEFRDIDLIGAPRFRIGDVGEPFQLGRYVRARSRYCSGVRVRWLLVLTSSFATTCPLLLFLTR